MLKAAKGDFHSNAIEKYFLFPKEPFNLSVKLTFFFSSKEHFKHQEPTWN